MEKHNEIEEYKKQIVEMIENLESETMLGYLSVFIKKAIEKWG